MRNTNFPASIEISMSLVENQDEADVFSPDQIDRFVEEAKRCFQKYAHSVLIDTPPFGQNPHRRSIRVQFLNLGCHERWLRIA